MLDSDKLLPESDIPVLSVTEVSKLIKVTLENNFHYIQVKGEISGFKPAPSGHVYFSIKDQNAILSCVIWRGNVSNLGVKLADGVEVICKGNITSYAGQSKYQMVVANIEMAGVGSLMVLLEKRKQQLQKEGLFDVARKKTIPSFPKKIGIITSPTGAVIRDIIHRLYERFPVPVLLWPVLVQGDKAAAEITAAIEGFNRLQSPPDVLIVARGGGSIEDLWAFNEEIVVRAVAASKIPIISAIGHETDVTLIDYAADLRAPTPTAAAELAVPDRNALLNTIQLAQHRMEQVIKRFLSDKTNYVKAMARGIISPTNYVMSQFQKLDHLCEQLRMVVNYKINNLESKLKSNVLLLESYNYNNTLKRGFVVLFDAQNNVISKSIDLKLPARYKINFSDDQKDVMVSEG